MALFSRDVPRVPCPCYAFPSPGRLQPTATEPAGEPARAGWQCLWRCLGKDSSASVLPFLCQGCRASPQRGGSLRMGTGDGSAAWPCPKSRCPHLQPGSTGIPGSLYSCPAPGASAAIPGEPDSGLGPCGCSWSPAEGRGFGRLAWVKGFPVPGKMPSRNSWWLHLAEW